MLAILAPEAEAPKQQNFASPTAQLATDVISTVKAKLKQIEASALANSSTVNSAELRGLKRLCEELMTRNISLETALEQALNPALRPED